jgi:hypothetical protein
MTVSELIEAIGQVRKKSKKLYEEYSFFRDQEMSLKAELMLQLQDAGLKSAKGKDFTASIAERPEVVITSESELMEWLQNSPNIESDFYIGVKKPEFKVLANQMLKESGELANGTKVEVRESLSIRSNKK